MHLKYRLQNGRHFFQGSMPFLDIAPMYLSSIDARMMNSYYDRIFALLISIYLLL